MAYPKVELHVHLEGTVRPRTLFDMARRNSLPLRVATPKELERLYEYRDFEDFIRVWIMTTNVMRRAEDFRHVLVEYAAEASVHGAAYIEGIFSPGERAMRGVAWDEIFSGYCDGIQEAREGYGVEVRRTPDIARGVPFEEAERTTQYAMAYTGASSASASAVWRRSFRLRSMRRCSSARGMPASGRCLTPAKWRVRRRFAARSTRWGPTGSGTASVRSTTRPSCVSSPIGASCWTCACSRICAPALCARWPNIRSQRSRPLACAVRSPPTTRPCSTRISGGSTRPPRLWVCHRVSCSTLASQEHCATRRRARG